MRIERDNKNWEAEFKSITYADAMEIEKDNNIKEISIYYDYGRSIEDFDLSSEKYGSYVNLLGYDENAINNSNFHIVDR